MTGLHHRSQETALDSQASGSVQSLGDTVAMFMVEQDKGFLGWRTNTQPWFLDNSSREMRLAAGKGH